MQGGTTNRIGCGWILVVHVLRVVVVDADAEEGGRAVFRFRKVLD